MPKRLPLVTPAELGRLAGRAHDLAAQIRVLHNRLRAAADQPTRRAASRLDTAAGVVDQAAGEIAATADDLARIAGRGTCAAEWGLCPEHGNTLTSTGGRTWCRRAGCRRQWDYDRDRLPCDQPATYHVHDTTGRAIDLCAGHAADARHHLAGARLTPIQKR